MKTNRLLLDILRGQWMLNISNVAEYEKLANRILAGERLGAELDHTAFRAQIDGAGSALAPEKKEIGFLSMIGPLATYGDWCSYGSDDYVYALRSLNENPKVSAIVLHIDGPGGAVAAINNFQDFKTEKKKPIVALCDDCYSAHYWIAALLADHVMANGNISSGFGSMGVMTMMVDAREAMAKEGYKVQIIRAPQSKLKCQNAVDFYAGKDEEFIARMETQMEPIAARFIADVKAARPNLAEDEALLSGDVFGADQALQLGLIDSIGNRAKAFELAQALAELNEN